MDDYRSLTLSVEPSTAPGRYGVILSSPEGARATDDLDLRGISLLQPPTSLSDLCPNVDAMLTEMRETSHQPRIDIALPADDSAALDWENLLGDQPVFRRPASRVVLHGQPLHSSVKLGIVQTTPHATNANALARAIRISLKEEPVEVQVYPAPARLDDLFNLAHDERLDALHTFLRVGMREGKPVVELGEEIVPLEAFVRGIGDLGLQVAVFDEIGTKSGSHIASLRIASQAVPNGSETCFVSLGGYQGGYQGTHARDMVIAVYAGMTKPERLDDTVYQARKIVGQRVQASCVANYDVNSVLPIERERRLQIGRASELGHQAELIRDWTNELVLPEEDRLRLRDTADHTQQAVQPILVSAERAPSLRQLLEDRSALDEASESAVPAITELEILQTTQYQEELPEGTKPQARYPAARFFRHGAGEPAPIPPSQTLSDETGMDVALHFWLDTAPTGIVYRGERPELHAEHVAYPITLTVNAWSSDFHLFSAVGSIELQAVGATNRVIFPLKLPDAERSGEIFIFLRHQSELVAVFRVAVQVTYEPATSPTAQVLEHVYLATDWFRFGAKPSLGAELSILVSMIAGQLNLFALQDEGGIWARVGIDPDTFHQENQVIYRELQKMALDAAVVHEQGTSLSFGKGARALAMLGSNLYSTLFFGVSAGEVRTFAKFIEGLPEGSRITVATTESSQRFMIPWGLLYDMPAPRHQTTDRPEPAGFWGYRFNLVVRPWTRERIEPYVGSSRVQVGMGFLSNVVEAQELERFYQGFEQKGQVVQRQLLAVDDDIKDLGTQPFDLIHFYCHGHTSLPNAPYDKVLIDQYRSYVEHQPPDRGTPAELLMKIQSDAAAGPWMFLDGGYARLARLRTSVTDSFNGRPLVLLSMCESAQVSTSGTGFVSFFLDRGARAVIGTEGPVLFALARRFDESVVRRLLSGDTISQAFWLARRELLTENVLALVYSLFGDRNATLVSAANA